MKRYNYNMATIDDLVAPPPESPSVSMTIPVPSKPAQTYMPNSYGGEQSGKVLCVCVLRGGGKRWDRGGGGWSLGGRGLGEIRGVGVAWVERKGWFE